MGVTVLNPDDELRLIKLARELAMDMAPVDDVLGRLGFTRGELQELLRWPRFQELVRVEAEAWGNALNTHERVKLKAAAMIEDWLPEAHRRLHDRSEALPAKAEVAKLVTRLAGMGVDAASVVGEGSGQRFSLVINIGDGRVHGVQAAEELPALPVRRSA